MKLIFGLGNPEKKFERTPHNTGFRVLDNLAAELGVSFGKKKMEALYSEVSVEGEKVLLLKPQTYMNNSGESVKKFVKKFKVQPEDMLIVFDDIDLKAGDTRLKLTGSAGTHNGMRNILALLGRLDVPRLRVGVGQPPLSMDLADFVLMPMPELLQQQVAEGEQKAVAQILEIVRKK